MKAFKTNILILSVHFSGKFYSSYFFFYFTMLKHKLYSKPFSVSGKKKSVSVFNRENSICGSEYVWGLVVLSIFFFSCSHSSDECIPTGGSYFLCYL